MDGLCFPSSMATLTSMKKVANKNIKLCHGIITITDDNGNDVPTVHAWVEIKEGNSIIYFDTSPIEYGEPVINMDVLKAYKELDIDPTAVKRYSRSLANAMLKKYKHYGPWL